MTFLNIWNRMVHHYLYAAVNPLIIHLTIYSK